MLEFTYNQKEEFIGRARTGQAKAAGALPVEKIG
jgi:hypothetical protein